MRPSSSFDALGRAWFSHPRPSGRWLAAWRLWFTLRSRWRRLRVTRGITALLGPEYSRSRDLIEIDITYRCNLSCLNCNRSVSRAPDDRCLPVEAVRAFVDESLERRLVWRRIRVLGGEPTLHPDLDAIINELSRLRERTPDCIVEVVTNGHGPRVEEALERLPQWVWVENSEKQGRIQEAFRPFSMAPLDEPRFRQSDYSNGCAIMRDCGMGLTPDGYFPCAIAGGIDRVAGFGLGRSELPAEDDEMLEELQRLCAFCGRFMDGHYVPNALREPLTQEQVSPTWERLYREYHEARRRPETPR